VSVLVASLPDFHPVAVVVSERVVACLIAGTVLTAGAGLALRMMSGQSARAKFALCFVTLAAIAAIPLVGWLQAPASIESQSAPPVLRLPEDWALYICAIWLLGAAIALGRVAAGLYRVYQVRKSCLAVASTAIDESLRRTIDEFQSTRRVELCASDVVRVPTAIGFFKPVVALPTWCVRDLSSGELYSIVLHELEHLRRYDDWSNLFQRIVGAVFFFHPAVWWLEGRLSLEREMACDDAVLAVVPDPKSYARCLVSLAEKSYLRRGIALAQAAVSRVHQLTVRVTQILAARRPGSTSIWKPALSIALVTLCAGGASLDLAPRLVAFERNSPVESASSRAAAAYTLAHGREDAFDLRATPARWIAPVEPSKPVRKLGADSPANRVSKKADAHAAQPVADDSRRLLARGTETTLAPERAVYDPQAGSAQALQAVQAEQKALNALSAQMLVVVVHSEQQDEAGNVFWSVRVMRWVVFHPQAPGRNIDPQVPAKT